MATYTPETVDGQLVLELGYNAIRSYRRLSYTAWHALAEFVDNSTQSYFNNRPALDAEYIKSGDMLDVAIVYGREQGFFRISDNSIGMSLDDLQRALQIGRPPADPTGRSKYGMGMKTAACWIGNKWSVRTTKLGDPHEYSVEVDVELVASGQNSLAHTTKEVDPGTHYTVIEIWDLNQRPQGRTIGKIKDYLRSMYRHDLVGGILRLEWHGERLTWDEGDERFLVGRDGTRYRKDFNFGLPDGKEVNGWLGVLDRGGRAKAGFAMIHSGRVVRGWPDSWRPASIFGQEQGSNDLVNQRIVGEVNLDAFEVTHTKDDILWMGSEDDVQDRLKAEAADYVEVAKKRRKRDDSERGPSDVEMQTAIDELTDELTSPELADIVDLTDVPDSATAAEAIRPVLESIPGRTPDFDVHIGQTLHVVGYLAGDLSPNDPYVAVDVADPNIVAIIVNTAHPFLEQVSGAEGFLNYLRQATYDAVSEWKAAHQSSEIGPATTKLLKDVLLRLPSKIEMRTSEDV